MEENLEDVTIEVNREVLLSVMRALIEIQEPTVVWRPGEWGIMGREAYEKTTNLADDALLLLSKETGIDIDID